MHESHSWFEGKLASFVIKGSFIIIDISEQTVLGVVKARVLNVLLFFMSVINVTTVVSRNGSRLICYKTIIVLNCVTVRSDVIQSDILEIRNFVENNYK